MSNKPKALRLTSLSNRRALLSLAWLALDTNTRLEYITRHRYKPVAACLALKGKAAPSSLHEKITACLPQGVLSTNLYICGDQECVIPSQRITIKRQGNLWVAPNARLRAVEGAVNSSGVLIHLPGSPESHTLRVPRVSYLPGKGLAAASSLLGLLSDWEYLRMLTFNFMACSLVQTIDRRAFKVCLNSGGIVRLNVDNTKATGWHLPFEFAVSGCALYKDPLIKPKAICLADVDAKYSTEGYDWPRYILPSYRPDVLIKRHEDARGYDGQVFSLVSASVLSYLLPFLLITEKTDQGTQIDTVAPHYDRARGEAYPVTILRNYYSKHPQVPSITLDRQRGTITANKPLLRFLMKTLTTKASLQMYAQDERARSCAVVLDKLGIRTLSLATQVFSSALDLGESERAVLKSLYY